VLVEREGAAWRLTPLPLDRDGPVFHLNDTAAYVWRTADGRRSVADIARGLSRAYGVSTRRAHPIAHLRRILARVGLVAERA
jgi:hypothetical protein